MDVQSMGQPAQNMSQASQSQNFEILYYKLKVETMDLDAKYKASENEVRELIQKMDKVKAEIPQAGEEVDELKKKCQEQSVNLETLETENYSLKQKITLLQQEKNELKKVSAKVSSGPSDDSVSLSNLLFSIGLQY